MNTPTVVKTRNKPRTIASIERDIERLKDEKENALGFNEFKQGKFITNEELFKKIDKKFGVKK